MAIQLGLINFSTTSTSSSTTLPSIVKCSPIKRVAQEVLEEMRKNFRSSYDILLQLAHITNLKEREAQLYQLYGARFLDYLQHRACLKSIKERMELACSYVEWNDLVADPITSALVAVAKYGMGGHREATAYAATQCILKEEILTIMSVTVVSDIEKAKLVRNGESSDSVYEHSFLLVGVRYSDFENVQLNKKYQNNICRILPRLKYGFVLDPILKLVCLVNEIKTKKGEAFVQYTKRMPFVSHVLNKNWAGWKLVLSDAGRILEIAQKTKFQKTILSEMERNVQSDFARLHVLMTKTPALTFTSTPAFIPPSRIPIPVQRTVPPCILVSKQTLPLISVPIEEKEEEKQEKEGISV